MNMLKIYIIDDEKKAIDNLVFLLEQEIKEDYTLKTNSNPLKAVEQIRNYKPDLVFLDVQMPHLDGFGILKELEKVDFEVIFITAYEQYAIQAIKQSALDYLLKPIDSDDLNTAMERFLNKKTKDEANPESIELSKEKNKIAIHQMDGVHFLEIDKIIRLESDGNYTKLYADDGKCIISSKTLKIFEDLLQNSKFIRVHNSHVVNFNKITAILKNEIVVLNDGSNVPLSRRKRKELRTVMGLE